jgi:ABC-type bacteriocin/lantibiotic exporter with double-glycine peptidase domain
VFIDKVLIQAYSSWARPIILGILLTAVFRGILILIQSGMLRRLQQRLATVFASGFVWHLLHLPSSYYAQRYAGYAQRYAGELSGRIELNDSVADVLSGRLTTSIIDGFMIVFYLSVMLQFDRVLTGIGVIFAALNFVVLRWVGRMRVDGNNQLAHLGGKACGVTISGLQTIRTIKASALESDFFEKWAGHFARLMNTRHLASQGRRQIQLGTHTGDRRPHRAGPQVPRRRRRGHVRLYCGFQTVAAARSGIPSRISARVLYQKIQSSNWKIVETIRLRFLLDK